MTIDENANINNILDGNNSNIEFTRLRYYEFCRKEIEREDNITHQRLTTSLTFQGFLVASMAVIFSRILPQSGSVNLDSLNIITIPVLIAIGIIGLVIAWYSYKGVEASRVSLDSAREEWRAKNDQWGVHPDFAPQMTGRKIVRGKGSFDAFLYGRTFAVAIPRLFMVMWTAFIIYILLLVGIKLLGLEKYIGAI